MEHAEFEKFPIDRVQVLYDVTLDEKRRFGSARAELEELLKC